MIKNKIISIQSRLIHGYVGNNIAELAIQLQGIDPIAFPTVLLAAHSGHKPIYGKPIGVELFRELITGIKALDVIRETSCVMSGYIRTEDIIDATCSFIQEIKTEYSDKVYICDPVMGENGIGLFIPEEIAKLIIEKLIPLSDILTPNHYELEYILNQKVDTIDSLVSGVQNSSLLKNKTVIVTSCMLKDSTSEYLDTVLVRNEKAERIQSPRINANTVGTGDLFAATLAAQVTKGIEIVQAVQNTTKYISEVLDYMLSNGFQEMNASCLLSAKLN